MEKKRPMPPSAISDRHPRILIVCAVDIMAVSLLRHHLAGLRAAGWEVHVACPDGPYVGRLKGSGFHVHRVDLSRTFSPLKHLRPLIQLAKLLSREKFDIVNTHAPAAGLVGRPAAWITGAGHVVHSVHGFLFHENMPGAIRVAHQALEWMLGRITDHLTFVSDEDRRLADRLGLGRSGARHITLYNGVDPSEFQPREHRQAETTAVRQELDIDGSQPVVGITARIVREKGFPEFLHMARELSRGRRPIFLVLGESLASDRDNYGPVFRREVEQAGLSRQFRFMGHTDEVARYLPVMDVFVLPSYREGFPISILEAMSAGLPVVATNIRGCRESVVHGETGLLVPPRDATAFAAAVEALLDDPDRARAMGRAGRARVEGHFNHRIVARTYVDFLSELLESSGQSAASRARNAV